MIRAKIRTKAKPVRGSRAGDDLVEAFREMAAYLRGEVEVDSHSLPEPEAARRALVGRATARAA